MLTVNLIIIINLKSHTTSGGLDTVIESVTFDRLTSLAENIVTIIENTRY